MPSAQYENAVSAVNMLLSDVEFYKTIREKLVHCVAPEVFSHQLLNRMIWRIASKLMEKIQERIFHQMKVKHLAVHESFSMNECDKEAFRQHICRILRCTFRFGIKSSNHVWKLRCDSLRTKFVVAPEEVKSEEFVDSKLWTEDSSGICLAPATFSLFLGLERVMQKMHDTGVPTTEDNVLNTLSHPDNIIIFDEMRFLTQGILSEDAAINFLKDLIKTMADLSGKMEAGRKFAKAAKKQPTAAVSLRTNLKRNPTAAAKPSQSSSSSNQEKAEGTSKSKKKKKETTSTPKTTKKTANKPKQAPMSSKPKPTPVKPVKTTKPTVQPDKPVKPKKVTKATKPLPPVQPKNTPKQTPTSSAPATRTSSRIRDRKK